MNQIDNILGTITIANLSITKNHYEKYVDDLSAWNAGEDFYINNTLTRCSIRDTEYLSTIYDEVWVNEYRVL